MVLAEVAPLADGPRPVSPFFLNLVNVRIMVGNRSGRRVQLLLDHSYLIADAVFVSLTPLPTPRNTVPHALIRLNLSISHGLATSHI